MKIIRAASELLGFEIIPYLFGKLLENQAKLKNLAEIRNELHGLDNDKVEDAVAFSTDLLNQENSRGDTIESKAQNLMGVTSITTGFIAGVASLLPEKVALLPIWMRDLQIVLYVLIALALVLTILSAFKVVVVGPYKYSYLNIDDVYGMKGSVSEEIRIERLASTIYAYDHNHQLYNNKATYLIGSQRWFRNAILLFLLLAICLAYSMVMPESPVSGSNPNSTPVVIQPTNITLPPTSTPIPYVPPTTTFTPRMEITKVIPIATVIVPTK